MTALRMHRNQIPATVMNKIFMNLKFTSRHKRNDCKAHIDYAVLYHLLLMHNN